MRDTTIPGTILGYRRNGQAIRLQAGGSDDGGSEGGSGAPAGSGGSDGGDGGSEGGSGDAVGQDGGDPAQPPNGDDGQSGQTYGEDYVKRLRDEAAGHRTKLRTAEQDRDNLKSVVDKLKAALDPNGGEQDPAKVAERATQERDAKDAELRALRIERATEQAARKHEADPAALTDSRSFAKQADELDPTADDFAGQLDALVKQAVQNNPKLRATQAATRSGSEFTGGSGGGDNTPKQGDTEAWMKLLRDK